MGASYPSWHFGESDRPADWTHPAALVNSPALLLADEPTGAVDTTTGEEIGRLLLELNQHGQTLVLVTHSPELAARYVQRTVQLVDGRVVSDTAAGSAAAHDPSARS